MSLRPASDPGVGALEDARAEDAAPTKRESSKQAEEKEEAARASASSSASSSATSPAAPAPPAPAAQQPAGEPCSICHFVVGTPSVEGVVEMWSVLPCGHRFGSYCLKVWLGMALEPACPVCRRAMTHVCGHPTLPRPAPAAAADGDGENENEGADDEQEAGDSDDDDDEPREGGGPTATRPGRLLRTRSRATAKKAVRIAVETVDRLWPRPSQSAAASASAPSSSRTARLQQRIRRHLRRRRRGGGGSGPRSASASASSSSTSLSSSASSVPPPARPASSSIVAMLSAAPAPLSAQAPELLAPAYPQKVDLGMPCTYCYLRFQRQPADNSASASASASSSAAAQGSASGSAGRPAVARSLLRKASVAALRVFTPHPVPLLRQEQLSRDEANIVAAYWESWRMAHGRAFGQWWAEQAPPSPPAQTRPAQGWNVWNMV